MKNWVKTPDQSKRIFCVAPYSNHMYHMKFTDGHDRIVHGIGKSAFDIVIEVSFCLYAINVACFIVGVWLP